MPGGPRGGICEEWSWAKSDVGDSGSMTIAIVGKHGVEESMGPSVYTTWPAHSDCGVLSRVVHLSELQFIRL